MAISNYYVGDLNNIGQQMANDRALSAQERIAMAQATAQAIQQMGLQRSRTQDNAAARAEQRYATDSDMALRRELAQAGAGQSAAARAELARQFDLGQATSSSVAKTNADIARERIAAELRAAELAAGAKSFDPRILDTILDAQTRAGESNSLIEQENQDAEAAAAQANQLLRSAFAERDSVYNANTPYLFRNFRSGAYDAANAKGQDAFNTKLTSIYTALGDRAGKVQWDDKAQQFAPRRLSPVATPKIPQGFGMQAAPAAVSGPDLLLAGLTNPAAQPVNPIQGMAADDLARLSTLGQVPVGTVKRSLQTGISYRFTGAGWEPIAQ